MRMDEELLYGEGAGYQAVDLPYVGYELSMIINPAGARQV